MAQDALGAWIVANENLGNAIPTPSKLGAITYKTGQTVCLVEIWLPIFREERFDGNVKKDVTVPVWLNALAEKANLNFSQVLQAGLKNMLGIHDQ
jgi:hypothetical protein